MAVHFHQLKVKDVRRETADCVSVSFEIPPGIAGEFAFREGQNITVKTKVNNDEVRRSYSICMAPHENELRVAVKKVEGGLFSRFANETLKPGDVLEVLPPTGKFNAHLKEAKSGNYLAIAAGSGITPIISIVKHTLTQQPDSQFTLIYGNQTRASIIFFEELEALKNKYMERFNFINLLSKEKTDSDIFYGRINEEKLTSLGKLLSYKSFDSAYICGPEAMIFSARDFLVAQGMKESNIHFELFTTPGQASGSRNATRRIISDSGPKSNVSIKLDGRSFSFDLPFEGISILDGALQQGADLPYACKGGVCATCRARLTEGEVSMDINYALEPEEVAQGFILTCQAHPKTAAISVDFDVK